MSTSKKAKGKPRAARKVAGGRAPLEMRIHGEAPYPERLNAYLAGDHSQIVSPQFAAAVAALGRQKVDLNVLTRTEKAALYGRDLRWQSGPDGILLWTDAATLGEQGFATELRPDFDWLYAAACEAFAALHTRQVPPWMEGWARSWAAWGHRYTSIVYDQVLQKGRAKGSKSLKGPALVLFNLVPLLKSFILGYLPVSGIHDRMLQVTGARNDGRWLLPDELLDQRFQGPRHDDFRDDFWNRCCADLHNLGPDGRKTNPAGSNRSHEIQAFLDFVAEALNKEGAASTYCCPFLPRTRQGVLLIRAVDSAAANRTSGNQYQAPPSRGSDKSCSWISREHPHLAEWEPYAREWIQNRKANVPMALDGLSLFIGAYLANAGKPGTASATLSPECARRPLCNEQGGDALLLREVWANLVGNAFKYTRPRERARIEVGWSVDPAVGYTFFVKDNGVGFDTKYAQKLFGVFQRLHRATEFEGTGIGLALTRRILERHGGSIWAESQLGEGSVFHFSLPFEGCSPSETSPDSIPSVLEP